MPMHVPERPHVKVQIKQINPKNCNFYHRENHYRNDCYQLKNKQKNNYQKGDYNRNKSYISNANFKNSPGNSKNQRNSKNDSSNFRFNIKTNIVYETNVSTVPPFLVENKFENEPVQINHRQRQQILTQA